MPMEREEKTCGSCIYFFAHSNDSGTCRERPPAVFMDGDCNTYTAYPTVIESEFCGRGVWNRHSNITNEVESYVYGDTKSTTYYEDRVLNKGKDEEIEDD